MRTVAPPATTAPATSPRRRRHRRVGRLLPPVVLLAALAALWAGVTAALRIDPTVLPGPALVVTGTWAERAQLWPAMGTTSLEAVLGLAVALGVAVPLAVCIDAWRGVRASVYPLVVASQTLPVIVLAPLVVIWFGFGLWPKVGLVALFSFFPIAVGAVQGLGSADADMVDLLRTMRATRWQLLTRVKLPAALPQLFTGLKISVTYAFTSAIVAEWVGATRGLGVFMTAAAQDAPRHTDVVLGGTVVTALLTVALFGVVALVQRAAMPWRPRGRA